MKFGIERLLADPALRAPLAGKRVALLAHPASVTRDLTHSLDALSALDDIRLTAVIEEEDGTKSYWALAHPDGPPDFHDPSCFLARLPE